MPIIGQQSHAHFTPIAAAILQRITSSFIYKYNVTQSIFRVTKTSTHKYNINYLLSTHYIYFYHLNPSGPTGPTRLYLRAVINALPNLPTVEGSTLTPNKVVDAETVNRTLSLIRGGSQSSLVLTSNATATLQRYYFSRFVSDTLSGITSITAQNWTFNFAIKQSDVNANFPAAGTNQPVRVVGCVWRPGTQSTVGDIIDANSNATIDEASTTLETIQTTTFSGVQVLGVQDGDVLCFEVWFEITQSAATAYTDTFYFDGTTVNTIKNSTVTSHASFIETPQGLVFGAPLARLTKSLIQKYNIIGRIQQPRIYKYNLTTRAALSRIYRYQIFQSAILTPVYKYNLIGRIAKLSISKYNILVRKQAPKIFRYAINSRLLSSKIYKYTITSRLAAPSSKVYKYNILNRRSLSRIYKYNLTIAVHLLRIYKYNLTSRRSLSRTYRYNLTNRIAVTRTFIYNLLEQIYLESNYNYDLLEKVLSSTRYKYNLLARILLSKVYKYNIFKRVTVPKIYLYNLISFSHVIRSSIHRYNIVSRLTFPRIYKYNILTKISVPRIYRYNLTIRASLTRIYRYVIVNRVTLSRIYRYNVLIRILLPSTRTYRYNLLQKLQRSRLYLYNISKLVSVPRIYRYSLGTRLSLARTYQYKVIGRLSKISTYRYNLFKLIQIPRIYKYSLFKRIAKTNIYVYVIGGFAHLTRKYLYSLIGRISLISKYRYSLVGVPTNVIWQITGQTTDFPDSLENLVRDFIKVNWSITDPLITSNPAITTASTPQHQAQVDNFAYDNARTYYMRVKEVASEVKNRQIRLNTYEFASPIELELYSRRLKKGEAFNELNNMMNELLRIFGTYEPGQDNGIFGIEGITLDRITSMEKERPPATNLWARKLRIILHYYRISMIG